MISYLENVMFSRHKTYKPGKHKLLRNLTIFAIIESTEPPKDTIKELRLQTLTVKIYTIHSYEVLCDKVCSISVKIFHSPTFTEFHYSSTPLSLELLLLLIPRRTVCFIVIS